MNPDTRNRLSILDALRETDLAERTSNERAQTQKAAMEHGPGAPCDANIPILENLERDGRRVDQVP